MLKPPTLDHVNLEDVSGLMQLQNITLYARISHPQGDYVSSTQVNPGNKVIN